MPRAVISIKIVSKGVGILEALIALFLLSLGLLAIIATMLQSSQQSSNALVQSNAVLLVQELTERMLANRPVRAQNTRTDFGYAKNEADLSALCANAPNPLCSGTNINACTHEQMVSYDLYQVACRAQNLSMPTLQLTIKCTKSCTAVDNPENYEIWEVQLAWDATDISSAGTMTQSVRILQ